jgi:hypothetical protein
MKIDKNIPVNQDGRGRKQIYPFDTLDVGDSFFVKNKTSRDISGSINQARKKHPKKKFKSLTLQDGVRVWRIK